MRSTLMIAAAVALFLFGGDGRADEKEDGKNSDKEALYTKKKVRALVKEAREKHEQNQAKEEPW